MGQDFSDYKFHMANKFITVDPEIRLKQFDQLCRREKTTEVVTEEDISLIRRFVYFNVNVSDQGFRQKFLTCIKYFLFQLKESGYAIVTSLSRPDDETEIDLHTSREILRRYQESVKWLIEFCFYCLRLHGNYARRASALHILELVYCMPILKDKLRSGYVQTWNLDGFWTPENVETLVSCLTDPYESNQMVALAILKTLKSDYFSFLSWPTLLQNSFDWCSTSKTQYPEIAVYHFLLAVHKTDLAEKESVAKTSFSSSMYSWALVNRNCVTLTRRLMALLQVRTDAAEKDLVRVSVEGPPWGLLKNLLYILKEVDWPEMIKQPEASSQWRPLIMTLLDICHRLTTVVAPIVNSISPEGYLPMDMVPIDSDFIVADQLQDSLNGNDDSENEVKFERWHHATCQAVLVCSWRTQKEISALFGFLSSVQHPRSLLEFDELLAVGDYFMIQLTECKHRGAFECAYAAFVEMCSAAWRSPLESTRELPKIWLRKIVDGVVAVSNGRENVYGVKYCVTRRSAGVPFLVQAVLATEPKTKDGEGSALLYETLQKLLRILFEEEAENIEDRATAKVHSLNILRALVRESKLGLACLTPSWLSLIAQADLLAFTHRSWAVRNSATLLFSAWIVRVFGVPRKRNEISTKNKLSATDFDVLCPDLFDFMLDQMRLYCDRTATKSTVPFQEMMLFPILSILARVYPSSSCGSVLRLFAPHVLNILLTCPVINVRRSAAWALSSLVDCDSAKELQQKFLSVMENGRKCSQNAIHGMLLWIENLSHANGSLLLDARMNDVLPKLSPLNAAVLLRIITDRIFPGSNGIRPDVSSTLPSELNGPERLDDSVFGPFTKFLLVRTLNGDNDFENQLHAGCKTNSRLRRAFYKQWRSVIKRPNAADPRLQVLIDLAKRYIIEGIVWRDVIGDHDDLKLRLQAVKFYLCLPPSVIASEQRNLMAAELLELYGSSSQSLLRRRYFELACHLFRVDSARGDCDFATRILEELDASSRPVRSLDDRLMVIDCLNIVDPEFIQGSPSRFLVILIRLLTDLEDVVRDEAALLFSKRFSESGDSVHSAVAVFTCVGKLLGIDDGKQALCEYLMEIVEELEKTSNDNAAEDRVFDKNEANYNLEPLLIAEWLRMLPGTNKSHSSSCDGTEVVDQCLITDGLNFREDPAKSNGREASIARILRNVVKETLSV